MKTKRNWKDIANDGAAQRAACAPPAPDKRRIAPAPENLPDIEEKLASGERF